MGGEVGMFGEKKRKDARDAEKKRRGADARCGSGEGRTWVERGRQTRARGRQTRAGRQRMTHQLIVFLSFFLGVEIEIEINKI
jgi:hypothetical protein